MDFASALKLMRGGSKLSRTRWNQPTKLVGIHIQPIPSGQVHLEYEHFTRVETLNVGNWQHVELPYSPTVEDILAYDWELPR